MAQRTSNPRNVRKSLKKTGYDNAFRITSIADTGITTDSWTVNYDTLDRITGATESIGSYGWTYDADGNWTAQTEANASAMTISPTSNQITGTTCWLTRTYAYDAAGNTLSYSNMAFAYNQRGRMSSATVGTTTSNYIYSALGQMIKKTVGSTTTLLMYDEAGHLLGEYSSAGALIQETVWMGDIPVGTLRPNGSTVSIYYVETDQINAVRKVTRPSDNGLMWHWNAYPFGLGSPNENPAGLGGFIYNLRFPGQYFQAETGLYYNNFRDYDYSTGKYLESDPTGLQAGVNTYAYVGSNPLSYLDPFGLDETHVINTSGGRSVLDGPTNGNWGGKCWSGGQYSCGIHPMGSKPPTDSADKCYMHHDNCYDKCNGNKKCMKACDAALLKELKLLSDDPTKWPEPPLKGTESDTMIYRNGAILIFRP
jgi:RHS repeat-associated protein